MDWWEIVGLAVGLSMDAFAVSLSAGLIVNPVTPRAVFRIAWHFGLFQALMPILGWVLGSYIGSSVAGWQNLLASGLLFYIGTKMMWEAYHNPGKEMKSDPSRGLLMVSLSTAVSIDAFAAGLSMAFLGTQVLLPCVIIGFVTMSFSTVGMVLAGSALKGWRREAEILGGLVLLVLAFRIILLSLMQ